jgi:spermidine/putrescine-binding protein
LLALGALSGDVAAQQPSSALAGTTLDVLALQGEDGSRQTGDWQAASGVTVDSSSFSPAQWSQVFDALSQNAYDVVTVANQYVGPWAAKGALMPLDVCRLSHWSTLFPALREADFIRVAAGDIVAVPIIWGDAPFIYAPDRVKKPPTSISDLLNGSWRRRLGSWDDPVSLFHMLAVARGFPSPRLSSKQLAKVKTDARKLVSNLAGIANSYDDVINQLGSGGVDLFIGGSEDMIDAAAAAGTTLAFGFFDESHGGGWSHAMAIPANAEDVDAAYAYIDAVIDAVANAALATDLYAATVDRAALPLLGEDAPPFDYSLVDTAATPAGPTASARTSGDCPDATPGASTSPGASEEPGTAGPPEHANARPMRFDDWNPPAQAEGKVVGLAEWLKAWQEVKGS